MIAVLSLGACGEQVRRGGAGESCTAADDCESGLGCFGQVCATKAQAEAAAMSAEGASCSARRDCATGLACVSGSCQHQAQGEYTSDQRYSGKGESCQAKNDCLPDLSCVMGMCRALEVSLTRETKSCHRVECASKDDCCRSFVPNPNCPTYEMNCAMDPIFCNTYRSLCQCAQDCQDEQCVAAAPGCKNNAECTSAQTPFCVEGKCRQCDSDAVCGGSGAKCSAGVCVAACARDENCPLLHACRDGVCVETGCTSDRECAFLTRTQGAVCREEKCRVPCSSDAECTSGTDRNFEVCEDGQCVFVGCSSNTECRALLDIANERGNVQAVCR